MSSIRLFGIVALGEQVVHPVRPLVLSGFLTCCALYEPENRIGSKLYDILFAWITDHIANKRDAKAKKGQKRD